METAAPALNARPLWLMGRKLPPLPLREDGREDWQLANPRWIDRALARTLAKDAGGWFALDASRAVAPGRPRKYRVAGQELVVWRHEGRLYAAPNACPHMGASLAEGCQRGDRLVCPWHGLALGPDGHGSWRLMPSFDDGVLVWVRLDLGAEIARETPSLPERPSRALTAVMSLEAACEPRDVISNRLDPWHGAHFHPYAFARLRVVEQLEDEITVRVAYRVWRRLAVEVDARFHCPDSRSIVMTIVRGEGVGSVVETHATPLSPGRSAVVEAVLATSERTGFAVARHLQPLLRPVMERAARRLWQDDAKYAERVAALRDTASASR